MTRESGVRKIRGEIQITSKTVEEGKRIEHLSVYQETLEANRNNSITHFLEVIFMGAINLRASDIHLEPEEEKVKMRLRIDGILHDVFFLSTEEYHHLLSRLKLISELKININDRPQDGRFSVVWGEESEIEIRISSLPSEYGEAVVMRILDPNSLKNLDNLGLRPELLQTVQKELKRTNGMILSTGPTGSGKTTTLYAFCRALVSPEIKIITIEDPIEYHLEGLSQTQVNPKKGYSFSSGLRSIVRQDPDVILVGEMRDEETVNIALQAALTGHLVLSTLHTNNAAGSIARLISLKGKPANIGPAINMVIAQRLVRKICPNCKKMEKPTIEELSVLKELGKISDDLLVPHPGTCSSCNNTGYKGRIGIFEIFLVGKKMKELISQGASNSQIQEEAEKQGMKSIRFDGLLKVVKGVTTIAEVERVAE